MPAAPPCAHCFRLAFHPGLRPEQLWCSLTRLCNPICKSTPTLLASLLTWVGRCRGPTRQCCSGRQREGSGTATAGRSPRSQPPPRRRAARPAAAAEAASPDSWHSRCSCFHSPSWPTQLGVGASSMHGHAPRAADGPCPRPLRLLPPPPPPLRHCAAPAPPAGAVLPRPAKREGSVGSPGSPHESGPCGRGGGASQAGESRKARGNDANCGLRGVRICSEDTCHVKGGLGGQRRGVVLTKV